MKNGAKKDEQNNDEKTYPHPPQLPEKLGFYCNSTKNQ